jgi:hypothetical protein
VCQAAVLAILLCIAVAAQAPPPGRGASSPQAAEAPPSIRLEAAGTAIEVKCAVDAGRHSAAHVGAKPPTVEAPCEVLARRAAQIVLRLTEILGPCPRKTLEIDPMPPSPPVRDDFTPGIIGVSPEVLRFTASPEFFPALLPFEIARQWFPNAAADARLYNSGMVEMLAQYLAWRYLLETDPEAARVIIAEAMRDSVAGSPSRLLSDVVDYFPYPMLIPRKQFDQRGLLVLRTLETVIDRERVDRVLPLYLQLYGGRSSSASVRDFERVCEEVAGRNLAWFFRYFFDSAGIPEFELRRLPSESPGVVAGEIVVKDFPPEGSVRVEMSVRAAQGVVEHSVATRGAVTPFTVNVPAPALDITLDPDLRILRWTEPARRSKAQSAVLHGLPDPITAKKLSAAVELYRRALAADPEDAALRAQALRERLGELEWAHDEWNAALADLEAAINGHSISPYETYLCRAKAYLYHGVVQLHERRPREAQKDARAGLALPRAVLLQEVPREPIESRGDWRLEKLLQTLRVAASRYCRGRPRRPVRMPCSYGFPRLVMVAVVPSNFVRWMVNGSL